MIEASRYKIKLDAGGGVIFRIGDEVDGWHGPFYASDYPFALLVAHMAEYGIPRTMAETFLKYVNYGKRS